MLADLLTAFRLLSRSPGYAVVVVVTLGLGIGGVAAVFTLADPMIFRPLPFVDADRIVEVRARTPRSARGRVHADDFVAIAAQSKTLDAVSTLGGPYVGRFRDQGDSVLGGGITREFIRLTGLQPAAGRAFTPDEYARSENAMPLVTMLTWPFWQSAFGGSPDVIGSRLELASGREPLSMEIVGVLPRAFFFPESANRAPVFVVPVALEPQYLGNANVYPAVLARVRPEYTFAQAEAEVDLIFTAVEKANPRFEQGRRAVLVPLQELLFSSVRTPLLLLFIATACLLMLALVNLTHLAQARARGRSRDVAVRVALGASRWRVVRLLLAEAVVLAVLGGAAGLLVGQTLYTFGASRTPRFSHIYRLLPAGLDARVAGVAVVLAAIATIAIGIWPALRSSRADLRSAMAPGPGRRRGWRVGGEALAIAGQTAFAVGLVVTCLLVVRSFASLVTTERGFDPARVRYVGVELPEAGSSMAAADRYRRLLDALATVRGVDAAGLGNGVPSVTLTEGLVDAAGSPVPDVIAYQVSGGFADAMGMRLHEGRMFTDAEAFAGAPVAVVDQTTAALLWPSESAIGKSVRVRSGRAFSVVGVLARVRRNIYAPERPAGTVFVSIDTAAPRIRTAGLSLIVRLDSRRPASDADLAAAVQSAEPGVVWRGTGTLTSWERLLGQPRFLASALGTLAVLTMLLAGFGMLGVVSHSVARRTREIGIRLALGADRSRVRRLVVRQALLPAAAGVTAGLVLASWWSATVRTVIVGISPHDPWSFAAAGAATLLTVILASAAPAARASRIDPALTLRAE